MSTKTSKPKTTTLNGNAATNGKAANGTVPKAPKPKKSMYERWIEKYGVDESKEAKLFLRAAAKAYENHNKESD